MRCWARISWTIRDLMRRFNFCNEPLKRIPSAPTLGTCFLPQHNVQPASIRCGKRCLKVDSRQRPSVFELRCEVDKMLKLADQTFGGESMKAPKAPFSNQQPPDHLNLRQDADCFRLGKRIRTASHEKHSQGSQPAEDKEDEDPYQLP